MSQDGQKRTPLQNQRQIVNSWHDEKQSAYLYDVLTKFEKNSKRKKMFSSLGTAAEDQSKLWEKELLKQGGSLDKLAFYPSFRARLTSFLIRVLGPKSIKPLLAGMKIRGLSVYQEDFPATHRAVSGVEDLIEKQHAIHSDRFQGGNLRAMVFGFSDGLVSNASLLMGVVGAGVDDKFGLLSGVAGLLAGAFSMAAGEYVSVKSQRELFEYQMALETEELRIYPEEEAAELALIYEAKGIDQRSAQELGKKMIENPEQALKTLAREELGLNPDDLGSPFRVAFSSFVSFGFGAIIPIIPFLFRSSSPDLKFQWLVGLSLVSLFGVGAALSLFSGRSAFMGGLRLVFIGSLAGGMTFLIGHYLGVSLG